MTLIDRLQAAGAQLPPSHVIDVPQLGATLGALVQFLQHGDDFLDAAEDVERGVIAFLTEHAESENERVAAEQAELRASQPSQGAVTQAPAIAISPMPATQQAPVFTPPAPADRTQELLGALLSELQSQRAERADRQRTEISVHDAPTPTTEGGDRPDDPPPPTPAAESSAPLTGWQPGQGDYPAGGGPSTGERP